MDRDREANTRCTWFTQIGYVHGVEEFSLIVKGLHMYIGSSSHFVNVTSFLEVLFLHPRVVSLIDEDAQDLVKCDTNPMVGVSQVAELGDLPKEVKDKVSNQTSKQATWFGGLFLNWAGGFSGFLQSIRPTQEFEGQNKSIKSRVRSTLMIWDTFAVDKVVDVLARVLLRLSPHASLYPSHLPYLFLRQMYLLRKHKMLKMSTREQCQVRTRPKEKTGKNHDMGYSCF
ncbi:hypothetical protein ACFX15_018183 [Malus domestica]